MNREIEFRGKHLTGKWEYGFPYGSIDPTKENTVYRAWYIYTGINIALPVQVMSETIGQWTGLIDRYKNRIYEHDIVKHWDDIIIVTWEGAGFNLHYLIQEGLFSPSESEVIGNKFDSPELIKW